MSEPASPTSHIYSSKALEIPFSPRVAQKVILSQLQHTRIVTAICHRRLGKTLLGVYYLISEALSFKGDDFRGYYFGATQKAAKQVAWHYFKKLLAPLSQQGKVTFRETELQVVFWNGGSITLAGSENIEAYRGIYIDRIVADEMASWSNAHYAWFEVLRPAMADRIAHGMIIGTVKGLDLLYEFYLRGISTDVMDSDFNSVKLPASMTGIIAPAELAELKHSMSEEAFEREMECNFFAETPDVLITPKEVDAAMKRVLTPAQRQISSQAPVILGLDVGRTGDPSVLYRRQGLVMERVFTTLDPDNMSVAAKVSRAIKIHKPTTVFVDAGQGQGVIDRLFQLGHRRVVVEVHFNETSPEKSCVNMRAAMYYRLKRWCRNGQLPDDYELMRELVNQELADDPNNRIKLALKKVIKQRIGRSPNDSDACALTLTDDTDASYDAHQQKEANIRAAFHREGVALTSFSGGSNYDPLGYMDQMVEGGQRDNGYDPLAEFY